MRHGTIAVAGLLIAMSAAQSQEYQHKVRIEVRPFAGMYVPTGMQGTDFKSATTFGMQAALELNSYTHVLASGGLTNGRSKIGALISDQSKMWQFDAGAEFNALHEMGSRVLLRPFVGVGAGMRGYSFKDQGLDAKSCAAGYGALGSELQRGAVALRLESRYFVTCFKSPLNSETTFRSDMSFIFGFAYHIT